MSIEARIIHLLKVRLALVMTAPEIEDDQIEGVNGFVYGENPEVVTDAIEIRFSWSSDVEGEDTHPLLHWRYANNFESQWTEV